MTYVLDLPRRPRFVFNDGTAADLTLSRPQLPWVPSSHGHGDSDISDGHVMASFELRRDELLECVLVFSEAEWSDVRRLVIHGQRAGLLTFYPDAADADTSYECRMVAPVMGERVTPGRREPWGDWTLSVTLKKTDLSAWTDRYYAREE